MFINFDISPMSVDTIYFITVLLPWSINVKLVLKNSIGDFPYPTAWGNSFYPTALKGSWGIVAHGVRMGGQREKVCPGCISETVRCRKLILGRDIG